MALGNDFHSSAFIDFDAYEEPSSGLSFLNSYLEQSSKPEDASATKWERIAGFVLGTEKAIVDSADSQLEPVFRRLARKAVRDLGASSDLSRLFASPSYLEVIGLGPKVVPLLLRDMRDSRRPWYVALGAITRHDAAIRVERGDIRGMMDAWLAWGKRRRILE